MSTDRIRQITMPKWRSELLEGTVTAWNVELGHHVDAVLADVDLAETDIDAFVRDFKPFDISFAEGEACVSSTPINNPPQVAILAIGAIQERHVVRNDTLAVDRQVTVSLSSDHRVVDGANAADFLATLSDVVTNVAGE